MNMQQICRFRLGEQGSDSGYQICGVSDGITLSTEGEFSGIYTTLALGDSDKGRPYVFDWCRNESGKTWYMTHINVGSDFRSRPTPLVHGIVMDSETAEEMMANPAGFLAVSDENFISEWDYRDVEKKRLPELPQLLANRNYQFSIDGIRQKYGLTGEQFTSLLYHIYEVILSDGKVLSLSFIWNGDKESYMDVIRDMMYVVYSMVPGILKNRLTFSSDTFNGMAERTFTVRSSAPDISSYAWFDLQTGNASPLQEIKDVNRYKLSYVEFFARTAGTPEAAELLDWMDEFAYRIYRRPDVKRGAALMNAMAGAFLTWRDEVADQYLKTNQIVNIANAMISLRVDDRSFLDEKIGDVVYQAIVKGAKLNDAQLENMQQLYTVTESERYRQAYQMALALKDQDSVYQALINGLKEEPSVISDNFIAFLLQKLPKTAEVQTAELIEGLKQRYYTTPNDYVQSYYVEYITGKYQAELTNGEIDDLILSTAGKIAEEQGESYNRAVRYIKPQIEQLYERKIKASESVFESLADIYAHISDDSLKVTISNYIFNVYMGESRDAAVEYYEKLRCKGGRFYEYVRDIFYQQTNPVLDYHFAEKLYPAMKKDTFEDLEEILMNLMGLPVYEQSQQAIMRDAERLAEKQMREAATAPAKEKMKRSQILYQQYGIILENIDRLNRISGDCLTQEYRQIRSKCTNLFWEPLKPENASKDCLNYIELKCEHPNCIKIYSYYNTLRNLDRKISSFDSCLEEEEVALLTTDRYLVNPKNRDSIIKRHIIERVQAYQLPEVSGDFILVYHYDNEKGTFTDKEFLSNLTENQWMDLEMNSFMLQLHPELQKELDAFKKKQKRGNMLKKLLGDRRFQIGMIAGCVVIVGIAAAIAIAGMSKKDKNGDESSLALLENETVLETENMTETQEVESESETESAAEESSTEESSTEESAEAQVETLAADEFEKAFQVTVDGVTFRVDSKGHVYCSDKSGALATNGTYEQLHTDETYLFVLKNKINLRRYKYDSSAKKLDIDTMIKLDMPAAVTDYEVTSAGSVYALADGIVYRVDFSAESDQIQETVKDAEAIAMEEDKLYAAVKLETGAVQFKRYTTGDGSLSADANLGAVSGVTISQLLISADTVYYIADDCLYQFDSQAGEGVELVKMDGTSNAVITDGCVYGSFKAEGSENWQSGCFELTTKKLSLVSEE